jgi:hypothetical protein
VIVVVVVPSLIVGWLEVRRSNKEEDERREKDNPDMTRLGRNKTRATFDPGERRERSLYDVSTRYASIE